MTLRRFTRGHNSRVLRPATGLYPRIERTGVGSGFVDFWNATQIVDLFAVLPADPSHMIIDQRGGVDYIQQWTDISGNDNHAEQLVHAYQPRWDSTLQVVDTQTYDNTARWLFGATPVPDSTNCGVGYTRQYTSFNSNSWTLNSVDSGVGSRASCHDEYGGTVYWDHNGRKAFHDSEYPEFNNSRMGFVFNARNRFVDKRLSSMLGVLSFASTSISHPSQGWCVGAFENSEAGAPSRTMFSNFVVFNTLTDAEELMLYAWLIWFDPMIDDMQGLIHPSNPYRDGPPLKDGSAFLPPPGRKWTIENGFIKKVAGEYQHEPA